MKYRIIVECGLFSDLYNLSETCLVYIQSTPRDHATMNEASTLWDASICVFNTSIPAYQTIIIDSACLTQYL